MKSKNKAMNYDEDVLGVGNYQHPANQVQNNKSIITMPKISYSTCYQEYGNLKLNML